MDGREIVEGEMRRTLRSLIWVLALMLWTALMLWPAGARSAEKQLTVGYQSIYNPWIVAIADGEFERATGYEIAWRKFESGSKVISAMVAGEVQVALAGSSPIAAGVSLGVDMLLFWIVEDIASVEALVVREGSGIVAPQDLKGKKLGVPFASTTHFHSLFALEQFGIDPADLEILNMQPDEIVEAWERGEIDAAFVWYPALGRIKKTGKVLITSGHLSSWGKATFDGMVASRDFAEANKEFMIRFVKVIAEADQAYRSNPEAWSADSDQVRKIVEMVGGSPEEVPGVLALYDFPTLDEQASCRWLGCGKDGGAARALRFTSEFLKREKKIDALQPDYGKFVTDEFVKAAME